jgi:uncharacterized protein YkwD
MSAALSGAVVAVAMFGHPTRIPVSLSPTYHRAPAPPAPQVVAAIPTASPGAQPPEPTAAPSALVVPAIAAPAPRRVFPRRSVQPPAPPVAAPAADCAVSALDGRTLSLLAQDRAGAGVAPVAAEAALCRAAAEHAAQNAAQDQMSHAGVVDDVHAQGLSPHNLGEVLGTWHPTPDIDSINGMWMQSPPHQGVIDSTVYTAVGVGWAQAANGDWFVSAIFTS